MGLREKLSETSTAGEVTYLRDEYEKLGSFPSKFRLNVKLATILFIIINILRLLHIQPLQKSLGPPLK